VGRDLDIGIPPKYTHNVEVQNFENVISTIEETTHVLDEATLEIARARRASELILGQEVEESD